MIVRKAYAKINWCLQVAGRRADGYHLLNMINQRIDLSDDMSFEPAEHLTLEVFGDAAMPTGNDNIVLRAARALQQHFGAEKGARICLTKRIPMGAGLGGGSADAACTLKALNELWSLNAAPEELSRLALSLGADVPYCLLHRPAIVSGIGEEILELPPFPSYWLVIPKPKQGLSTKEVFMKFAMQERSSVDTEARSRQLMEATDALKSGNLGALKANCGNDLLPAAAALLPEIEPLIGSLYAFGAEYAQMSGAGSTVFGAFTNAEAANAAQVHMRKHAHFTAVVATK